MKYGGILIMKPSVFRENLISKLIFFQIPENPLEKIVWKSSKIRETLEKSDN